jgi:hypothetical protein
MTPDEEMQAAVALRRIPWEQYLDILEEEVPGERERSEADPTCRYFPVWGAQLASADPSAHAARILQHRHGGDLDHWDCVFQCACTRVEREALEGKA